MRTWEHPNSWGIRPRSNHQLEVDTRKRVSEQSEVYLI
jgi:hypothetical protein